MMCPIYFLSRCFFFRISFFFFLFIKEELTLLFALRGRGGRSFVFAPRTLVRRAIPWRRAKREETGISISPEGGVPSDLFLFDSGNVIIFGTFSFSLLYRGLPWQRRRSFWSMRHFCCFQACHTQPPENLAA